MVLGVKLEHTNEPTVRQCDKKGSNFTQGLEIS